MGAMRLISFNEFLKQKGYSEKDLSKEEVFRYGQIAILAGMADILGISLTYNGLDWVEEVGKELKKLRDEREGKDDTNEFLYPKSYLALKAKLDSPDCTYDGIKL